MARDPGFARCGKAIGIRAPTEDGASPEAARVAATSTPECIRRLYPTGASKKGRARSKPNTRVRKSHPEIAMA